MICKNKYVQLNIVFQYYSYNLSSLASCTLILISHSIIFSLKTKLFPLDSAYFRIRINCK